MKDYFLIDAEVILSEKIDNDTVVINLNNGCYFNFNPTASFIWELIGCGLEKTEILSGYSSAFGIPSDNANTDIENIIAFLTENDLVRLSAFAPPGLQMPSYKIPYIKPAIEKFDDMQEMLLLDPIHEVNEKGWPYKNDE